MTAPAPLRPPAAREAARRAALVALALAFGGMTPLAPGARAQTAPAPQAVAVAPQQDLLTQAQLEQLLAPVALYPDDLLMQVLMAATYPLEVVQAKRWLGQGRNGALRGDDLARALEAQPWDPSVKSLVPFPDVLGLMNDRLDWTQQLGDAVLDQQQDVFNAIQVLRNRAQAAGMLASGPEQTVTVTQNVTVAPAPGAVVAPPPQTIVIAPTQPERVYVPVYDPNVVFGTWPHPGFPPAYFPPPVGWGLANALLTGMAFAAGTAIVGSLWGWGRPNWGRGSVDVNVNRFNSINVNRTQITNNEWRHNAVNRHGVPYRNPAVADRVGASRPGGGADRAAARDQFRGRMDEVNRGGGLGTAPGQRPGLGDRPGAGDRPGLGARPGPGDRPALGDRLPGSADRPSLGDRGPGGVTRPAPGDRPALGDRVPGGGPGGLQRPDAGGGLADRAPGLAAQRPGGQAPVQRPAAPPQVQRPAAPAQRPALADRPAATQRPAIPQNAAGRPQPRPAPAARPAPQGLQGIGDGGRERAAAQRGAASRQGQPAARQAAQQRAAARPANGGGGRGGGAAAAARGRRN
jgi:hypothetical protein